jgi:hypothetical protein
MTDEEVAAALHGIHAPHVLRKPFDTALLETAIESAT